MKQTVSNNQSKENIKIIRVILQISDYKSKRPVLVFFFGSLAVSHTFKHQASTTKPKTTTTERDCSVIVVFGLKPMNITFILFSIFFLLTTVTTT
jgi:hypothetical protein